MIGFGINQAKSQFFDRPAVSKAMDRAGKKALSKFGAFVRQRAQSSMLGHHAGRVGVKTKITNREGTSPAGSPPSPHLGLLIKFLFFAWDAAKRSVVIGPAKLSGHIGNAPESLEYGGVSQAIVTRQRQRRLVSTRVAEHPYMRPAQAAELPRLPGLFRDQAKP